MEEIYFKIDGPVLKNTIPVHLMIHSFKNLQSIFDKTYLTLCGKQRLNKEDRLQFHLRTYGVKTGSLESTIAIVLVGSQLALPFLSQLGPKEIWDYTKHAFEFLKLILTKIKEGKVPQYSFTGNDNSILNVMFGDQKHIFNAPVYFVAKDALPFYQKLVRPIQSGGVDNILIGKSKTPEICLSKNEKEIFTLKTKLKTIPQKIICEIFDFNKFENVGKLVVYEDQPIVAGNYRFSVIGKQDVVKYIEAMLKTKVSVTCLIEESLDPFNGSQIINLQIMDIEK